MEAREEPVVLVVQRVRALRNKPLGVTELRRCRVAAGRLRRHRRRGHPAVLRRRRGALGRRDVCSSEDPVAAAEGGELGRQDEKQHC